MNRLDWRRFHFFELSLIILLIVITIIHLIGRELIFSNFLSDVLNFSFFFSLGLYLGFRLCKREYSRLLKKANKN